MTRTKRIVFGTTVLIWLALCGVVLWSLIRRAAATAPGTDDDYALTASYQVWNFSYGYLPTLLLLLGLVLLVEHLVFWLSSAIQRRRADRAMPIWVPFQYREFYDVPRQIILRYQERSFLLDCPFDESLDEYAADYEVFSLPELAPGVVAEGTDLRSLATGLLGRASVRNVRFDASCRSQVDVRSIPPVFAAG